MVMVIITDYRRASQAIYKARHEFAKCHLFAPNQWRNYISHYLETAILRPWA